MATASSEPPKGRTTPSERTVLAVSIIACILIFLTLLTLYFRLRKSEPLQRPQELQLQAALRRSAERRSEDLQRRRHRHRKGIPRSLLQSFAVTRYQGTMYTNRQSSSWDLERIEFDVGLDRRSPKRVGANGATQVAIVEDEEKSIGKEEERAEVEQTECPICTQPFTRGDCIRILPCQHLYHKHCVDSWLLNFSATCPVCREDFNTITPSRSLVDAAHLKPPERALVRGEELS